MARFARDFGAIVAVCCLSSIPFVFVGILASAGSVGTELDRLFTDIAAKVDGNVAQPPVAPPRNQPDGTFVGLLGLPILVAYLIWLRPVLGRMSSAASRRLRWNVARSGAELFQIDDRPSILLLRSFNDDFIKLGRKRSATEWLLGIPESAPVLLEETIANIAFRYGPVAALQNPQTLPRVQLGAARDISTNDDWKSYVASRLGTVADVVFILGRTQGLRWEMETIVKHDLLHKLIIVIPPWGFTTISEVNALLPAQFHLAGDTSVPLVLFGHGGKTCAVHQGSRRARAGLDPLGDSRTPYEEAVLFAFHMRRSDHVSAL